MRMSLHVRQIIFLVAAAMLFSVLAIGLRPAISHSQVIDLPGSVGGADFSAAVRISVRATSADPDVLATSKAVAAEDYRTTWDEFGTNALVDGALPVPEIKAAIVEDAVNDVATEQAYDRQEAANLEASGASPQEMQAIEQKVGIDVPSDELPDPNPSIDHNPDAVPDAAGPDAADAGASASTATDQVVPSEGGNSAANDAANPAQAPAAAPDASPSSDSGAPAASE